MGHVIICIQVDNSATCDRESVKRSPGGATNTPERDPRRQPLSTESLPREPFRYPDALELARARALKEPSPAAWGQVGGLTTLAKYGPAHFRAMSRLSRLSIES